MTRQSQSFLIYLCFAVNMEYHLHLSWKTSDGNLMSRLSSQAIKSVFSDVRTVRGSLPTRSSSAAPAPRSQPSSSLMLLNNIWNVCYNFFTEVPGSLHAKLRYGCTICVIIISDKYYMRKYGVVLSYPQEHYSYFHQ